jgi:hypothetical protein
MASGGVLTADNPASWLGAPHHPSHYYVFERLIRRTWATGAWHQSFAKVHGNKIVTQATFSAKFISVLDLDQITDVAQEIARANFGARRIEDVRVEPMADWTGADALRVLIVLHPSAVRQLKTTDKAAAMLNGLGERLDRMGEPRFAYVSYATREELDASDDPES